MEFLEDLNKKLKDANATACTFLAINGDRKIVIER